MFEEAWDQQYPASRGGLFPHPPTPSELTHQVGKIATTCATYLRRQVHRLLDIHIWLLVGTKVLVPKCCPPLPSPPLLNWLPYRQLKRQYKGAHWVSTQMGPSTIYCFDWQPLLRLASVSKRQQAIWGHTCECIHWLLGAHAVTMDY